MQPHQLYPHITDHCHQQALSPASVTTTVSLCNHRHIHNHAQRSRLSNHRKHAPSPPRNIGSDDRQCSTIATHSIDRRHLQPLSPASSPTQPISLTPSPMQSLDHTTHHRSQPTAKPVNRTANQPVSQSASQPASQPAGKPASRRSRSPPCSRPHHGTFSAFASGGNRSRQPATCRTDD